MKYRNYWMVIVVFITASLLAACKADQAPPKIEPAHVEPFEDTDLSLIELTDKAAERIDIQTVPVGDELIARKRVFGGKVVEGDVSVLVRVALNESDLNSVDRTQPVIIRPMEEGMNGWKSEIVVAPDPSDTTKALYCAVARESGFVLDQRVLVEVSVKSSGTQQWVIPYAAVLYDTHGDTWVYTKIDYLTFVRAPIIVEYIEGDLAVLSDGPPTGTEVVTAGAGELFGAEYGIGGGGGH